MTHQSSLWAAAQGRVRTPVLLPLLGGNVLLLVAAVLGLKIPDSHTWQLLLSLLLALGLISGFLLWNATALRRMRGSVDAVPLWKGALLLAALLLLAAVLLYIVGLAQPNIETRAGYWNSQMSTGMRHLLPYTRLVTLQQFAISVFRWILIPALLLPFAVETATFALHKGAFGRAFRVLLSVTHWFTTLVALGLATWLVPVLTAWHPSHTVTGEAVSAVLRLGAAALLVIVAAVLLMAVDAELLHRQHPEETAPLTLAA